MVDAPVLLPWLGTAALVTTGAVALYLATPNQRLRARRLQRRRAIAIGATSLLLALLLLLRHVAGPATSLFILLTLLMLIWTLLPVATALLRIRARS